MNQNDGTLLIYTTVETLDAARLLGRGLVDARLAACVNIISGMTSIYEWEGEVDEASEVVMIVKTNSQCLDDAMRHLKSTHPYDIPALIVIDPLQVDADFAAWIVGQTGGAKAKKSAC